VKSDLRFDSLEAGFWAVLVAVFFGNLMCLELWCMSRVMRMCFMCDGSCLYVRCFTLRMM
jgi:hypothetical protein